MYPFASLPDNLAAFCRVLADDHGFRIGPREVHDAIRALEVTPIGDERAVRDALRPVLGSTRDEAAVFDAAFAAFFHPRRGLGPAGRSDARPFDLRPVAARRPAPRRAVTDGPPEDAAAPERRGDEAADAMGAETGDDDREDTAAARLRARASAMDAAGPPPDLQAADAAWRQAARAFARRIEVGRARAWRPAPRGPRFDLRRTLRGSLHTGGEVLLTRWRDRPRRRPRFVVIVDGSRSMHPYVGPALRLAVALTAAAADVDVFAFSTTIRRVTSEVRLAALGLPRALPELHHAWGGGTSLGDCLTAFVRGWAERLVARRTIVIVASDGLDTGRPAVVREAMAQLHRTAAAIVWLNPLLETPGYAPTAGGMRAARPFITTLDWVQTPADLRRLAGAVRLRRW
ncbi:MAG: VWA domain-containing protein [Vicinamibacterales bacterium]